MMRSAIWNRSLAIRERFRLAGDGFVARTVKDW